MTISFIVFYQERIGEYLSSSRDTKAVGRRPFDKMATLLAYLGPPEHRAVDTQFLVSNISPFEFCFGSSVRFIFEGFLYCNSHA